MKRFTKMTFFLGGTMTQGLFLSILLSLFLTWFSNAQAQMITVTPTEFSEGMKNPLMGLRESSSEAKNRLPYNTVVRSYIFFNELDNGSDDGLQKIIDVTNAKFKDYEKWNIKVIVRVILQYSDGQYYWPSDLKSSEGDYSTEVLRKRVLKLVENIGKVWDNDSRIAWVEMGLIGKWGEQESPMDVRAPGVKPDNKSWAQILGPAFKAAFTKKQVQVRGMSKWTETLGFEPGMYWDTWASYSSMTNVNYDYNAELIKYNNDPYNRYKKVSMGGEIAYSVGVKPELIGTDANSTYKDAGYRRWIKNCAAQCRTSVLGLEYSSTDKSVAAFEGYKDLQKGFGYRFLIKEFQCSQQTQAGSTLNLSAKIVNEGIAPFYEKWPVAFVLIDENTKQIVYKSVLPNVDVSSWMPGEKYDWKTAATLPGTGTEKFLIPAATNTINASVTIPAGLASGTYLAGLAILDPTTNLPGIFFSVNNFVKTSNTQPLCQIGIGVAPSNPLLNNVLFDNYDFANDSRFYSLTPLPNFPVIGVTVTPTSLSIPLGGTGLLKGNLQPSYSTDKNVTWTSSNTSIATIDANGLVTAKALGTATMEVKTSEGNFISTCTISVIEVPVCSLPWNIADFTISTTSNSFTSNPIDISCATAVTISMDLSETDFFESADKLTVSYKLDGGNPIVIKELINDFTSFAVNVPNLSGSTLEILVNGVTDAAAEIYYIKNMKVTATALSVKDNSLKTSAVKVYPNPASGILNIDSDIRSEKVIHIINSLGQVVSTTKSNGNAQIDLKSLKVSGFVIVQVIADGKVSNHKVIVK